MLIYPIKQLINLQLDCVNNKEICGNNYVGGIQGHSKLNSTITTSNNNGDISGNKYVGGIVGCAFGTVNDSNNNATVVGDTNVGGIIGQTNKNTDNNDNFGDILAINGPCGGIVGNVSGNITISNCDNSGYIRCCNTSVLGQIYGAKTVDRTVTESNNTSKGKAGHACFTEYNWTTDKLQCTYSTNCEIEEYKVSKTINAEVVMDVSADGTKVMYTYNFDFKDKFIVNKIDHARADLTVVDNMVTVYSPKQTDSGLVPSQDYVKVYIDGNAHSYTIYYSKVDVWDGISVSTSLSGSGTKEEPYLIQSGADLAYLAKTVREHTIEGTTVDGAKYTVYSGKYFKLTKSIDLNGNYLMVGKYVSNADYSCFAGIFDGNNCSIRGLNITENNDRPGALFAAVSGTINNLSIYGNIDVTNQWNGGLVGILRGGTLDNCTSYVTVSGTKENGGLVGYAAGGVISNCINYGSINSSDGYSGGIVGKTHNTKIENCTNYGAIYGVSYIGGIVGWTTGAITNCANYGTVNATSYPTGGIAGYTESPVSDSNNYGAVSGINEVGGVVGYSRNTITKCNNYGSISATASHGAGIVGNTTSNVTSCINYGDIIVGTWGVAGIAAYADGSTIKDCVNNGDITKSDGQCGGIIGKANGCTVISCTNNGNITVSNGAVGGIIGQHYVVDNIAANYKDIVITSCENNGNITANGSVGGIVGQYYCGSILDSINTGNITGNGALIGGIVGSQAVSTEGTYGTITITECTNEGSVTGGIADEISSTGGIVGRFYKGSITSCENIGAINGVNTTGGIAGLVAWSSGNMATITDCINRGNVNATSWLNGGIAGRLNNTTMTNCHNYGNVKSTGDNCGGIVASVYSSSTVKNCTNSGTITTNSGSGGITYANSGTLENCSNSGNLYVTSATGTYGGVEVAASAAQNQGNGSGENTCSSTGKIYVQGNLVS